MFDENTIKFNIGKIRQEKKLSQEYVASVLDINRNTYRNIECGKTNIINPHIYKLADILNTKIEELLFNTDTQTLNDETTSYNNNEILNLRLQITQYQEIIEKQQNKIQELEKYNSLLSNAIKDKEQIINFLKKDKTNKIL